MLNTKVVSLSFSITAVLLYLLCALFVYLWPTGFLSFINTWLHGIDLTAIASSKPFTVVGFLTGLISIFIASYLTAAAFSVIYNSLNRIIRY